MTQDTMKRKDSQEARALIDQPEKWTQCALRRDFTGSLVQETGRPVVARCADGAIGDACEGRGAEWKEVSGQLRRLHQPPPS